MTLFRWWLSTATVVAVLALAAGDLVRVAGRPADPARLAAATEWPAPAVRHVVPVVDPSPSPVPPSPVPPSRVPLLAPNSVAIPVQHVRAPVVSYCQIISGGLEPPSDVHQVCYWAGGAGVDDTAGTTVLTGHINWVSQGTGAFGNLGALHRGQTVLTSDAQGKVTVWRIARVEHRPKRLGIDPAAFVGHGGPRQLYLVSCGGAFDPAELSYVDNIYVRARPAAPSSAAPTPPLPPPVE